MTTILELADEYAKAYFMGNGDDARKLLQAAVMTAETEAHESRMAAFSTARWELGQGGTPEEIDDRIRQRSLQP